MTLTYAWVCLDCGATGTSDREAEKHTRTEHHATHSWAVPG